MGTQAYLETMKYSGRMAATILLENEKQHFHKYEVFI